MSIETRDLAGLLAELRTKAGSSSAKANTNASITYMRQVSKILGLYIRNVKFVARGPKPYYALPVNELANPTFETDLTSWSETIDVGITATTARDNAKGFIEELGGITSVKINITASTGAGNALRRQSITASAGQIWSFEVGALVTALSNAKGILRIEWLDGASAVLQTNDYDFTSAASTWVKSSNTLHNLTAPVGTVNVRVSLILRATAASGTGTIYYDNVIAYKHTSVRAFATRGIAGYSKAN